MEQASPHQPPSPTEPFPPPPAGASTAGAPNPGPTLGARRAALNPAFQAKLAQMSTALAPLVQLTTGAVHPAFPRTLLAFWLLTEDQLDSLAHFYHQRTPGPWTLQYPCPVPWPRGLHIDIEEKRRRLGRFIGLRGCESPPCPVPPARGFALRAGDADGDGDVEMGGMAGLGGELEEVVRRDEDEIVEAARRDRENGLGDEVDEVRRKMGWY